MLRAIHAIVPRRSAFLNVAEPQHTVHALLLAVSADSPQGSAYQPALDYSRYWPSTLYASSTFPGMKPSEA